jgi:hypothetical protein
LLISLTVAEDKNSILTRKRCCHLSDPVLSVRPGSKYPNTRRDNDILLFPEQGRIQDFKLGGGAHLKKMRRAEGGANFFLIFRVKNHDFTPKNHIFFNFKGGARRVRPPGSAPAECTKYPCNNKKKMLQKAVHKNTNQDV